MKSPIFLFSLPRSGSTLLQRVLMTHKDIASVAEPWLMLPFSYAYKREGVLAEYSHYSSFIAIEDFIDNLPNKESDYYEALGVFANTLYKKQCLNQEQYFLDKTPRYYLIINEIVKVFPDAKFIFLFRNPVHVMSSIMQTWSSGGFKKMYAHEQDLNFGLKALSNGYSNIKDRSFAVQYEKFVKEPKKYTIEICEYLDIEFDENMLSSFSNQDTKGRMGDPTGIKKYTSINSSTLDKWKQTFNTRFRREYLKNYINSIDESIFTIQGYNKDNILNEINELNVSNSKYFSDKADIIYSELVRLVKPNIWFSKAVKNWTSKRFLS